MTTFGVCQEILVQLTEKLLIHKAVALGVNEQLNTPVVAACSLERAEAEEIR